MAYNNGFPINYQQPYFQPMQMQMPQQQVQVQPQPQHSSIIWVQGEAGAKSYLVAPNNTVQLWDSESQTIYLKSADASGMPSIRVLDYTIRDVPQAQTNVQVLDYPTRKEFENLKEQLQKVMNDLGMKEGNANE